MVRDKILIVDDEEGIRDVISMIVESYFDHEILLAESGNQAIEVLKKEHESIGLIFCDYRMSDGNGGDVYNFIKENNMGMIPYVLCSTYVPEELEYFETFTKDNPHNSTISKPFTSEDIVGKVNLSMLGGDSGGRSGDNYVKIDPEKFIKYSSSGTDVFIKLSDEKYIKIIDGWEVKNADIIRKYMEKGVDYLYLEEKNYTGFIEKSLEDLFDKLDDDSLNEEEHMDAMLSTIESIHDCVKNLGINANTIALVERTIASTEKMIKKTKSLNSLLDLLNSKKGYLKDHAYLTSFIACCIADTASWKTEGIWKKIIKASFFHNISLNTTEEGKIFSLKSDQYDKLNLKSQELVANHMFKSVDMLDGEELFPEEVKKMILSHHELPDGSGFPRGLTAEQISPLEALFILSVNFAHSLLTTEIRKGQLDILAQDYNELFNQGHYKKTYLGFLVAFKNIKNSTDD